MRHPTEIVASCSSTFLYRLIGTPKQPNTSTLLLSNDADFDDRARGSFRILQAKSGALSLVIGFVSSGRHGGARSNRAQISLSEER
jgi:hypothetical protein